MNPFTEHNGLSSNRQDGELNKERPLCLERQTNSTPRKKEMVGNSSTPSGKENSSSKKAIHSKKKEEIQSKKEGKNPILHFPQKPQQDIWLNQKPILLRQKRKDIICGMGFFFLIFFRYAAPRARSDRIEPSVMMMMSDFAPICISLVISLLVSWILLGLPFLFSSNSIPEKCFRKISIGFLLLGLCYFLCLKIGSMDLFLDFFERGGISVVGRFVYSSFLKMGFSGGMVLAIVLTVKALLTFGVEPNMMMPSGSGGGESPLPLPGPSGNKSSSSWTEDSFDLREFINSEADPKINARGANHSPSHPASEGTHCPPLSSRASTPSSSFFRGLSDAAPAPELGEEVLQVSPTHSISQTDLWNELSPSAPTPGQDNQRPLVVEQATPDPAPQEVPLRDFQHQTIKNRLATLTPQREVNDDQVDAIICLKEAIVDRMAKLDPHPFWAEQKDYLVAHGILNKEAEYTIGTLEKNLEKLTSEGQNSFFF